jgi:hypothetical protein
MKQSYQQDAAEQMSCRVVHQQFSTQQASKPMQ